MGNNYDKHHGYHAQVTKKENPISSEIMLLLPTERTSGKRLFME